MNKGSKLLKFQWEMGTYMNKTGKAKRCVLYGEEKLEQVALSYDVRELNNNVLVTILSLIGI